MTIWLGMDEGTRCNAIGVVANFGLAVLKFTIGTYAMSEALVADGFNSSGDVIATVVAFVGYRYAQEPPDDNHHYGHGNADPVAALMIGAILLATGIFISLGALRVLVEGVTEAPGTLAMWAALATALIKEGLFRYTTGVGRRLKSSAILASARDHRADVYIAVTVFAGIGAARLGVPWLDPAVAFAVGGFIAYMAWEPIRDSLGVLMDEAPEGMRDRVHRVARAVDGVREADHIRIHPIGASFRVDLEIYVDGTISVRRGHTIAEAVEDQVKGAIEDIEDVQVHVNPTG